MGTGDMGTGDMGTEDMGTLEWSSEGTLGTGDVGMGLLEDQWDTGHRNRGYGHIGMEL